MNLEKHEELLKEAQEQYPNMVLDGAVDNTCWNKEKIRVLWVLKELNEFPKSNDLRSLLRQIADDPEPDKIYSGWESAYGLPISVSCEFMKSSNGINYPADKRSILSHIAVIAINKDVGVRKSSHGELLKAGKKFRKIVLKQIDLLDPTVVILADTFQYLYDEL